MTNRLAAWGTSMVAGNQDGTGVTMPAALGVELGLPSGNVFNRGRGGSMSRQAAIRFGAIQPVLVSETGTIPASGSVEVSDPDPDNHAEMVKSWGPLTGYYGGVLGTMTWAGAGDTNAPFDIPLTFTRSAPGSAVSIPGGAAYVNGWANLHRGDISVFWAQRNEPGVPSGSAARAMANLTAMVDWQTSDQWLIIGETSGDLTLNDGPRATWPDNFVDLLPWLRDNGLAQQGIPPTAQDQTDIANGRVPSSLRVDLTHFNQHGYEATAHYVATVIASKGWLDAAPNPSRGGRVVVKRRYVNLAGTPVQVPLVINDGGVRRSVIRQTVPA